MRSTLWTIAAVVLLATFPVAQTPSAPGVKPAAPGNYSFQVLGKRVWNDTGLDLVRGQSVHVYSGTLTCSGPVPDEKDRLPLQSAPGGALLAKLHLDDDPVLATPDAQFPVLNNSHLYLRVNGGNCTGSLAARVRVENSK